MSPAERPAYLLAISVGVRRSGREADHPQPYSGNIENKCSRTSIHSHLVVRLGINAVVPPLLHTPLSLRGQIQSLGLPRRMMSKKHCTGDW